MSANTSTTLSTGKILVSGVKPTGRPHIGNYFGAMKQFVDLQDSYESRIFVANLHALTTLQDRNELARNARGMAIDYLSIGLDPSKTTLYYQSDVPHIAELAWILECITTMPYLMRAHAFKDAEAKNKEINVGVFNYPLLMAADILIHDADVVPVGKDQKQHVEIARDTAEKFNTIFGETFKIPEPLILQDVATVPGIDGQKMSKSYNNTIPLFSSDEEIEKTVMSIVTDSGQDVPKNVYEIHKLVRPESELKKLYAEKKGQYKELKIELIKDLKNFIAPIRARRAEWESKPKEVDKILAEGGKKMRKIVHEKMIEVRKKVGLIHNE
ncbi:MAG: tryptophan--tRNA ligase [Candidatus Zambryskibacteria bacterium RIFCSPLOWO2_12_FULL_45_14]|uniref:Tryptophan--tRNA ligase n=1 Tax=Candidatus Zambryskibacteria bacterium RIFCSPLOWO2_12_FULL_45_14 TaxID=1802778 RepID=A0A1G2UWS9_9BACT|nr:MAG: tryptophan--tRNA ligase [Candidatus Zambryskibacteria bacterium RIFCSPLOWO2_12_FULL_45_14]